MTTPDTALRLIISPLAAAALVFLYVQLTLAVVKIRKRDQISLGDAGQDDLQAAIRAHANFSEWVPLGLLLIVMLEINAAPILIPLVLAVSFVAGRFIHSTSLQSTEKALLKKRTMGMKLTIYSVIGLAAANVFWVGFRFFAG